MPKFVLVDDHPIVLSGLAALFRTNSRYQIVDTGSTSEDALRLARKAKCDVLVADLHLLGDRFETIRLVRAARPDLKIIVFTDNACPATCLEVMNAGVDGFILKDSETGELISAIETILAGQGFISVPMAPGVSHERELEKERNQQLASLALSSRENQVARELLHGASNKEIAIKLNISYKTVKFYMNQIIRKFAVRNRVEVVLELQRMTGPAGSITHDEREWPLPAVQGKTYSSS